jgi:hypothetical protein
MAVAPYFCPNCGKNATIAPYFEGLHGKKSQPNQQLLGAKTKFWGDRIGISRQMPGIQGKGGGANRASPRSISRPSGRSQLSRGRGGGASGR